MNAREFVAHFEPMCAWYNRAPNELAIEAYYDALRFLSFEQWTEVCKAVYSNHKWLPTPSEILVLVSPIGEEKAIEQWSKIHAAACRGDESVELDLDEAATRALATMTNGKTTAAAIRELGRFDSYQSAKWESQFKRCYLADTQRVGMDALPGSSPTALQEAK